MENIDFYAICLTHKHERLKNIESILKVIPNLNIAEAIDASKFTEEQINKLKQNDFFGKRSGKYVDSFGRRYQLGAVGCFLSHHLILKHIAASKESKQYAVVFEDDVELLPNFTENFQKVFDILKDTDFDIANLHIMDFQKHMYNEYKEPSFQKVKEGLCGTQCYIVKKVNAHRVLKCLTMFVDPIDEQLSRSPRLNYIHLVGMDLVKCTDTPSYIQNEGVKYISDTDDFVQNTEESLKPQEPNEQELSSTQEQPKSEETNTEQTLKNNTLDNTLQVNDFIYRLQSESFDTLDVQAHEVDMQGWMSDKFPDVFASTLENKNKDEKLVIVEVGSWKGLSAVTMADICKESGFKNVKIITIDTWLGAPEFWIKKEDSKYLKCNDGYPSVFYTFSKNIKKLKHHDIIVPFPISSIQGLDVLKHFNIEADIIYIDAAHQYESVKLDITSFWSILKPGGSLIGDDYGTQWPGVKKAVTEFATENNLIHSVEDIVWSIKKPLWKIDESGNQKYIN